MELMLLDEIKPMNPSKSQFLNLDEKLSMLKNKQNKKDKNKFKTKGIKNKNNPVKDIKNAREVIISKQANYTDCISCHSCINNNVYKVFDTNVNEVFGDGVK